jgi:hypothetical protein
MIRSVLIIVLLTSLVACRRPERVDARAAAQVSDAELKAMVDRLFVDYDPERANFRTLMAAGDRAVPFLVQALGEPRTQTAVFKGTRFDGTSPFDRICSLLSHANSAQAVDPLTQYLQHADPAFRGAAASVLARIGTVECLQPVKKALADPERRVREYCLGGIRGGLKDRRQSQAFLAGVFEAVAPLLKDGDYDPYGPANVLAAIDAGQAAPLLESPECFTTRNPQLRDVLKALNFEGHKTPHAILMPLLRELAPAAASNGRRGLEFASALRLYARNPDADAEATFRGLLYAPNDSVATGAASALEILAGIDTARVMSLGHDSKFAIMTTPQRYYFAVSEYHYEVCNGGHDQFFGNTAGNLYPTVVEGLWAMGASSKAAILDEALRAFGMRPATDRTKRQAQMERLSGVADTIWRVADQQYYESEKKPGERIEVLLSLWAVGNRGDFERAR